jgi:hypothetical protein
MGVFIERDIERSLHTPCGYPLILANRCELVYAARVFTNDEQLMHPVNPQNPGLLQVATEAQNMATNARQVRTAVVFQTVSMVSMAVVGVAAAAHLLRDLLRGERVRGRG